MLGARAQGRQSRSVRGICMHGHEVDRQFYSCLARELKAEREGALGVFACTAMGRMFYSC